MKWEKISPRLWITLILKMDNIPNNTIAYCPIKSDNDSNNVCYLTDDSFIIIINGKSNSYLLSNILSLSFKQKKMLFPIVVGGIIGSFFLIALFNFNINIWIALSLVVIGYGMLYYGFQGSPTITITTSVKEYDHFLQSVKKPLRLFINFISNEVITTNSSELVFFLPLDQSLWEQYVLNGIVKINDKTYLQSKSQITLKPNQVLLKITVSKLNIRVSVDILNEEIHPFITNNINLEAVELVNYS